MQIVWTGILKPVPDMQQEVFDVVWACDYDRRFLTVKSIHLLLKPLMMDRYELPITFNGKDLSFSARLITLNYMQKFEVLVDGRCVVFEPDEEGKYRAVSSQPNIDSLYYHNLRLLKEIAAVIQYIID